MKNKSRFDYGMPSYAQSVHMLKAYNSDTLNRDGIEQIMSEMKANRRGTVKVSVERLQAVVSKGMDAKKTEDFIIKKPANITVDIYSVIETRRFLNFTRNFMRIT